MPAPAAARRVAARVGENGREHRTHAAQVCITYVQYGFFWADSGYRVRALLVPRSNTAKQIAIASSKN